MKGQGGCTEQLSSLLFAADIFVGVVPVYRGAGDDGAFRAMKPKPSSAEEEGRRGQEERRETV